MAKFSFKWGGVLAGIIVVASSNCSASTRGCTDRQADAADASVDHLDHWAAVQQFRRLYRQCDDGAIAEGVSEAVIRLLADKWDTLPQLVELIRIDPLLAKFVLRHINATVNGPDLVQVGRLAAAHCPTGATHLCVQIGRAAKSALHDMEEFDRLDAASRPR